MSEWINKEALLEQIRIDSNGSPGWYGDEWKFIDTINNMPVRNDVRSDLISRCELFNRLATIAAPPEANDFKAEIYNAINEMETVEVAYPCNRERCDDCAPWCDLTTDPEFAAVPGKVIVVDRCGPSWIPVEERLPEPGSWAIWCSNRGIRQVARWKEDAINHFFPDQGFFDLEDAVAWMPLPKPYRAEGGE